jgi:hypothetical protein
MMRRILIIMPLVMLLCLQAGSYQWTPSLRWRGWYVCIHRGTVYALDNVGPINGFRIDRSNLLPLEEQIGEEVKRGIPVRRISPFGGSMSFSYGH